MKSTNQDMLAPPLVTKEPAPPALLNGIGRVEWRRLVRLLIQEGVYTQFDRAKLLILCIEYQRYIGCIKYINKHGETWAGKNGYVQIRPEATQANKSFVAYVKAAASFGLDPESRSKIKKNTPSKTNDNSFEGL